MELLLAAGANKDVADCFFGKTTLHLAATRGRSNVVRLLLEAGADKDVKNAANQTPLDLAISFGHREVIELLQQPPTKRQKLAR